jgi:phage terminase large subunit-like protein
MVSEADKQKVKDLAEKRFFVYMCLINPHYAYGEIHAELCDWIQDSDSNRRLGLLPRGHLKSHVAAGYASWRITKQPWITIVYLSAGEDLAKNQIYAIKNMMTSDVYRTYWPEMLHADEGQREQWSAYSFNVDHPERKRRGIRDHTIIVKTVKSNAIGLHCDLLIPDDVVIPQFADTAIGRGEVNRSMAQFTSILNPRGEIVAVGTRYHPEDFYQTCVDSEYQIWDHKLGRFNGTRKLWDVFQRQVEDKGDGTGEFLWPLQTNSDTGDAYGFDVDSLAVIRADYEAKGQLVQFFCQYYNDPNAIDTQRISRGHFQYYDRKNLKMERGSVFLRDRKLSTFAAMDVAWTDGANSDYTAIVVIGMDQEENVYVLDLVQFKTDSFNEYFNELMSLHRKWDFRKLLIETNAGGHFVKQELDRLVRQNGETLSIEGKAAPTRQGSKTERKNSTLEWRYADMKVWHYKGGLTSEFEDQIVLGRPKHDDLADAFVAAISIAKPPGRRVNKSNIRVMETNQNYDSRFGGRRGRAA